MNKTYNLMHQAYLNIFNRLGIKIIPTISDNGTMGGNISEEFQAITNLGEDIVLYDEKNNIGINKEVLGFDDKDTYLKQLGIKDLSNMKEYSSVELGNNFQLGTKYSESMNLFYKDETGNDKPYYMGCYGIGLGRIIATIIENNVIKDNDEIKGFSLPIELAPYKIQIIYKEDKKEIAENLYNTLNDASIKCIIDDRIGYSLGNKIKDVYTLGTPYLAIIGDNSDGETIEIEKTKTGEKANIKIKEIIKLFSNNS
jgi:prolyl-tRNA synthetase